MTFLISRFASVTDCRLSRESISWSDLVTLLSFPCRASCTQKTCSRMSCPYKCGPCWSPAIYASRGHSNQDLEAVSLLVLDIDQATDDQIDVLRGRMSELRYLAHSTHSDRPDSRCLRFVFPLSRPVPLEEWASFWRVAQWRLVPIADLACADAGRVYFLPNCPVDASYFIQVNEGATLDVDAVLTAVPYEGDCRVFGGQAP